MRAIRLGLAFVVLVGASLGGCSQGVNVAADQDTASKPAQPTPPPPTPTPPPPTPPPAAVADVVQRGYDADVSGATLNETTLTTANVAPGSFGLVFTLPVDANILAQPLYVPNVLVNKAAHNVLYVATMNDTLYAFDADQGRVPLWTLNLATYEQALPVPIAQFDYGLNFKNDGPKLGILSTPVIDHASNTLYAVSSTLENGSLVYRLHAVDITTGVPRMGSGVVISGSYGSVSFDARNLQQRVSLVLAGDNVVFGFSAMLGAEDCGCTTYSGWVMAYDKSTLAQTGIFAAVTTGNGGGGVWQSGRPPAVDSSGDVYVFTGNGFTNGYDGVNNFSESVLKLDPAQGLRLVDWFTPSNWPTLDAQDLDLSSSGPMLVPGTSLLVGGGKTGVLYVLRTGALGKNTADDSGAAQQILDTGTLEVHGGPVYWQRAAANGGPLMYDWSGYRLRAFPFNGSAFATTPAAEGTATQFYPGGILTLSANGDAPGTGVLWATIATCCDAQNNPPVPGALVAFDASDVSKQLWNSTTDATHDSFGNLAKFVPPLVANGRVYVVTWSNQVAVYGLKP